MKQPTGFHVHSSGRGRRGSKLLTAAFLVVGVVGVGGAVAFWSDRKRLVEHVARRDHLAVPAAWVMSLQGPPSEAREPLVEALEKGEPRLRAAAARALGAYGKRDLVAELGRAAVADDAPDVRRAAVEALGAVGESNGRSFVERALHDEAPGVRAAACDAVASIGMVDCIPTVVGFLGSTDLDLRQSAKRALDRFLREGEPSHEFDQKAWLEWYHRGGGR
ncbi:MAG: HEAT repeat domain-containing protein [Planctomycetes bacterium]|nr:HEAT repeat domain-containing protein [Planctomycetota bacterium]